MLKEVLDWIKQQAITKPDEVVVVKPDGGRTLLWRGDYQSEDLPVRQRLRPAVQFASLRSFTDWLLEYEAKGLAPAVFVGPEGATAVADLADPQSDQIGYAAQRTEAWKAWTAAFNEKLLPKNLYWLVRRLGSYIVTPDAEMGLISGLQLLTVKITGEATAKLDAFGNPMLVQDLQTQELVATLPGEFTLSLPAYLDLPASRFTMTVRTGLLIEDGKPVVRLQCADFEEAKRAAWQELAENIDNAVGGFVGLANTTAFQIVPAYVPPSTDE